MAKAETTKIGEKLHKFKQRNVIIIIVSGKNYG